MTKLNKIEVEENGTLSILYMKDDNTWHRTTIPTDIDPTVQQETVKIHLESMGFTGVDQPTEDLITAVAEYVKSNLPEEENGN